MKLRQINEGMIGQLMRATSRTMGYMGNNMPLTDPMYSPSSGHDSGARINGGGVMLPTGIPNKPRHRAYLGLRNRGFSLMPPSL